MIPEAVTNTVRSRLAEIEQEHNVQVLLAVESGSRAWGFASTDSDYDIRFIYRHPAAWYINVLPRRDVIEYPIVDLLDYSGWDIQKALFLLNKSNPVLFEWLQSPIIYAQSPGFVQSMSAVTPLYFSPIGTIYHYLHMAENNFREYLRSSLVKVKKYFYVLRPLLACYWIEKFATAPPMEFDKLRAAVLTDPNLNSVLDGLLARKRSGVELGLEPQIPEINEFVETSIARFRDAVTSYDPRQKPDPEILNTLLVSLVMPFGGGNSA